MAKPWHQLLFSLATLTSVAVANPVGGNITAGNAIINEDGPITQINQTSQEAIIQWQSFNIKANEKTHFQQPPNGVTLNRVDPQQGASQIDGALLANGRVILINAAGIHFNPGSVINVGSIIASTADITDTNFLDKKYIFDQPSKLAGVIINEGTIKTEEYGLAALLGAGVINSGSIKANLGNIVLAAGNKFTLDFNGDQLVNFTVTQEGKCAGIDDQGKVLTEGVHNSGELLADGGQILISARVATHILDKAINMEGVAEAHSTIIKNGIIILTGDTGKVEVSGKLDASGEQEKEVDSLHHPYSPHHKPPPPMTGGDIQVLGGQIELTSSAILDASGSNGGGNIFVGGNFHGEGPLPNAITTTVSGAILNASATLKGNGGNIIVWSNKNTTFLGKILTQGTSQSGHDGLSEVGSFGSINYR